MLPNFFRIFTAFIVLSTPLYAQVPAKTDSVSILPKTELKFNPKQLIIPAALFTYGIVSIESDYLKLINTDLRNELDETIDDKFTIDDFSQYAPAASVYALNACGIKGKNNFRDRSIILGTSYLLMSTSVYSLKTITKVKRPDGTSNNSFPSGHTATAFAGAEFLWQEYKDVNIWYGIAGFGVAAGTGAFRIYNRRHWLSDVAMGAGIGILTTKISYWIFPYMDRHLFKSTKNISSCVISPYYNGEQVGIGMLMHFQ